MEQHEGKLRSLTLQEKLELISIVESGRSVKDVAEEYAVNRNTLHYIIKNKDTIKSNIDSRPGISSCKRIKKSKSPELEKRILEYMIECRDRNEKLSGSSIKAMALVIATELQVENFSASNGWLFGLFKRHQITISEFNKGIGPSIQPRIVPANESVKFHEVKPNELEACVEEIYEESTSFAGEATPKAEYELVNFEYSNNCNDLFVTEIVEEQEERIVEEETQESDFSWRNWCRMCGGCETTQPIDLDKAEIFQQLSGVSWRFS
jgi:transposase-like protein